MVPGNAYWGIHTLRAKENFPISNQPISTYPELVQALAVVKQAAARANCEIGTLDAGKASAIDAACLDIRRGLLRDEFCVDVIQGGAGTSTNMNANEVIANRSLELLGYLPGQYEYLDPIDDVNRSQSTNDVYPTAIKLAIQFALGGLLHELSLLSAAFSAKGIEFRDILKVGRTQLQDAVPMTLGREFSAFAFTVVEDRERIRDTLPLLREINLGATAIGTGITADPKYAESVRRHLSELTGIDLVTSPDLVEATSDAGVFMTVSAAVKRSSIKLSKICNDLRLLSSGPQAGLGEITLPARQAGSSIMPGKVNPVIPEVVNQVAFAIAGADVTVTMAAESGQLQLNAFEPVIVHSVLQNTAWLASACRTLRKNCVDGIRPNTARLAQLVDTNIGIVTALTPYIGYAAAASVAHTARAAESSSIADLVVAAGLMSRSEVEQVLSPARLSGLATSASSIPGPAITQRASNLAPLDVAHSDETFGQTV